MFVVCTPEQSDALHQQLLELEVGMYAELGLHFQVCGAGRRMHLPRLPCRCRAFERMRVRGAGPALPGERGGARTRLQQGVRGVGLPAGLPLGSLRGRVVVTG